MTDWYCRESTRPVEFLWLPRPYHQLLSVLLLLHSSWRKRTPIVSLEEGHELKGKPVLFLLGPQQLFLQRSSFSKASHPGPDQLEFGGGLMTTIDINDCKWRDTDNL